VSLGGRPCAQGKKREIVPAVPMTWDARMKGYARQAGAVGEDGEITASWWHRVTPRQCRRLEKKRRHHDARNRAA
jgi:hypothetical protein